MKNFIKWTSVIALCASTAAFAMDEKGWASTFESMAAFDSKIPGLGNRPGYVKPIIANLGNVLNSNWYVSAEVPKSPVFEAGLPISLIPIGDDDKTFNESLQTGDPFNPVVKMENPTIFGDHHDMTQPYDGRVYGNETLNGLGVFTYPYLQLAGSMFHARVVLRGMWLPAISELKGFSELGFGLQYSFGHLFQYMLPPAAQGLNVSLVFGYNSSSIGYQPEDYEGQMDLDISTLNFSLVIGYKPVSFVEVMMSLGYQSAELESSGSITCMAKDKLTGGPGAYYGQTINPDITVKGNNGFRFSLAVAFQIGSSFHPVLGFDYAGKSSFTTNVLYFKQQIGTDKTPDEIAQEKGYVRGAKNDKVETKEEVQEEVADSSNDETSESENDSTRNQAEDAYSDFSDDETNNEE